MTDSIQSGHVLVFDNNKVLLVQHGEKAGHITGVYGIPGGRIDKGEKVTTAATREFLEETGLEVEEGDLQAFPSNSYTADIARKDGTTRKFTMTVFVCQKYKGTLKKSEETNPKWISVGHLDKMNLLPNVKKAIAEAWSYLLSQGLMS